MTEAQWLKAVSPKSLLKWLEGRVGERKLRLFAVACRGLSHSLFTHPEWADAVNHIEREVEGAADFLGLGDKVGRLIWKVVDDRQTPDDPDDGDTGQAMYAAADGISLAAHPDGDADIPYLYRLLDMVDRFSDAVGYAVSADLEGEGLPGETVERRSDEAAGKEQLRQVGLVHEVFGNPFRPISLPYSHRTPTIVSLARAAYDERQLPSGELDPSRLAVLSDALEEAGATGEILDHLRSPGPHVRGCWAIDAVLGLT